MPTNSPGYRKKKRKDWKTNYEHYQGTKTALSYRAKLNQANRKRGTYGNGDNRDLMHQDNIKMNFAPKNLKPGSRIINRRNWAKKAIRTRKKRKANWGKY